MKFIYSTFNVKIIIVYSEGGGGGGGAEEEKQLNQSKEN